MRNVRDLDSLLSKIFRRKLSKILICLMICSTLFLLNIMVMIDQYSLDFFLICSFLLLLVFVFIYILFLILKTINRKNNGILNKSWKRICKCVKSRVQRDYQKDLMRFHNKWEFIFYYCGEYLWLSLYVLFFKWKLTYQIMFWCTNLLFCAVYRLMLYIIYEKYDKEDIKNDE